MNRVHTELSGSTAASAERSRVTDVEPKAVKLNELVVILQFLGPELLSFGCSVVNKGSESCPHDSKVSAFVLVLDVYIELLSMIIRGIRVGSILWVGCVNLCVEDGQPVLAVGVQPSQKLTALFEVVVAGIEGEVSVHLEVVEIAHDGFQLNVLRGI